MSMIAVSGAALHVSTPRMGGSVDEIGPQTAREGRSGAPRRGCGQVPIRPSGPSDRHGAGLGARGARGGSAVGVAGAAAVAHASAGRASTTARADRARRSRSTVPWPSSSLSRRTTVGREQLAAGSPTPSSRCGRRAGRRRTTRPRRARRPRRPTSSDQRANTPCDPQVDLPSPGRRRAGPAPRRGSAGRGRRGGHPRPGPVRGARSRAACAASCVAPGSSAPVGPRQRCGPGRARRRGRSRLGSRLAPAARSLTRHGSPRRRPRRSARRPASRGRRPRTAAVTSTCSAPATSSASWARRSVSSSAKTSSRIRIGSSPSARSRS